MRLLKKFKIPTIVFRIILSIFIMSVLILPVNYFGIEALGLKYSYSLEKAPNVQAIIILGAHVFSNGQLSQMLAHRLDYGYELYKLGKAEKIIVSGDHGTKNYDEVNAMRNYLLEKGVLSQDIFMDHAGFDTYDTMFRAKEVFLVTKAIVVSQQFHMVRGVYIGRELGMEVFGVASDPVKYYGIEYNKAREIFSRLKAFFETEILKSKPKFLGETIPYWENGEKTKG